MKDSNEEHYTINMRTHYTILTLAFTITMIKSFWESLRD